MEDLILILVLSGIGLVTLLVSVWLFYRKKRKTTEKKRACTAECRAAIVDVGNYHARNKHRMLKAAGGVSAAHFLSGAGGTGRRAAAACAAACAWVGFMPFSRNRCRFHCSAFL